MRRAGEVNRPRCGGEGCGERRVLSSPNVHFSRGNSSLAAYTPGESCREKSRRRMPQTEPTYLSCRIALQHDLFAPIFGAATSGPDTWVERCVPFASVVTQCLESVFEFDEADLPLSVDVGVEYRLDRVEDDESAEHLEPISLIPSKEFWAGGNDGDPSSGFAGVAMDKGWPAALVETYSLLDTAQGVSISGLRWLGCAWRNGGFGGAGPDRGRRAVAWDLCLALPVRLSTLLAVARQCESRRERTEDSRSGGAGRGGGICVRRGF